jgi:hypothetical protein
MGVIVVHALSSSTSSASGSYCHSSAIEGGGTGGGQGDKLNKFGFST